ncbi:MAG: hypothetical protein HKN08_04500 [Gammaproteobacteria bacterium]|nr:hypothetical protein [Gammaproteobacteria bacterium]
MISRAKELAGYSFLVVFANDSTIDENELHMLERLALDDNEIDEQEKEVLKNLFSRVSDDKVSKVVAQEIRQFRDKYDI